MKFFLTLLILNLISSSIALDCQIGCLKCGKEQKCKLCDYDKFYYLNEGFCKKMINLKCKNINLLGNCLSCLPNYFLDTNTKKCVKVEKPLQNCLTHTSDLACAVCNSGFYLEGLLCLKVPNLIKNCYHYRSKDECRICEETYELTSDGSGCFESPNNRNCGVFTNFKCHSCQKGYFYNPNYYFDLYFTGDVVNDNFMNFIDAIQNGSGDKYAPSGCQKINVQNCLTVETVNKCKICQNDYYLKNDKTCEKNPSEPINYCDVYVDYLKCSKCEKGFWLENPTTCKRIVVINNCLTYDQTIESVCLNCASNFYLQTNTCIERTAQVENCSTYFKNRDDCETCNPGFEITTDKKLCLNEITNCTGYDNSDLTTLQLKCNSCNNGHYINLGENACLSGQVDNCELYSNKPTECLTCKNLFYLKGGLCEAHKSLTGCENYSSMTQDTCTSCITDHILFKRLDHCIINVEISFCATHSNAYTCSSCQDGYKLQGNICMEILIDNCLQVDLNNECIKCKPGYFIETGLCHLYYEYQTQNCSEIVNDGFNSENNLNCGVCKSFNFPKSYLNHFVCVLETRLVGDNLKITNCKKHQLNGSTASCDQCMEGYYVNKFSGDCVAVCSGTRTEFKYVGSGNPFNVHENPRKKLCVAAVTGCEIQSMDTFGDMQCLKCATDYVPTYLSRLTLKNIDGTYGEIKESQGVTYPTFTCVPKGAYKYNDEITTIPPNCLVFKDDGTDNWTCTQCKFGKTGPIKMNKNTEPYVECDKIVSGCNDDYYGGFHFEDYASVFGISSSLAFNCHSCYDLNHIPVSFAISTVYDPGAPAVNGWTTDNVLRPFNLDIEEIPINSQTKVGHLTQCLQINTLDLTIPIADFTATFTPNCAMAFYQTNRKKNLKNGASDSEISVKCAECEPGFKKILEIDNTTSFVQGCNKIENCDNDNHEKWINSCSKCITGFSWKWDIASKRIRYDECIQNYGDDNCMAISGQSPIFCKYCHKGYILNLDGKCEALNVPKTIKEKYTEIIKNLDNSNPLYKEMYLIEYLNPDGIGSTHCDSGYLPLLRLHYENYACTGSDYLTEKVFKSELTTNFVQNCKDYTGNKIGPVQCKKCADNFIPSITNLKCFAQSTFQYCSVVNSNNTTCHTCIPTFTLRNNKCERGLIKNCVDYDGNSLFQKCNLCSEGYFVSVNTKSCVLGLINNCQIYNNSGTCTKCQDTFGLALLNNNKQSCINLKDELKCDSTDTTAFKNHEFKCSKCSAGYSLTQNVTLYDPTVCLPINPIENCSVHDIQNNLITSTLACNKCKDSFYTFENGLKCYQRDLFIDNCLKMSDDSQTCSECQPKYYSSFDKKLCLENPVGIFFCNKYKRKTVCETCDPGYSLKENLCNKVTDEEEIKNCAEYLYENNLLTCSRCNTNFFGDSPNSCIVSEAQNCLTFESSLKCKTCSEGYVFKNTEKLTECIYQPIDNCAHVDPLSTKCETCKDEFYPNALGKCSKVQKSILKCIIYSAEDLCRVCDNTSFLSLDKKSCVNLGHKGLNLMENCEKTTYDTNSHCLICKEGHLFIEGVCESCLNSIESGCFSCDPTDTSVCITCISGYHQKKHRGGCEPNEIKNNSDNDNDNTDTSFGFILNFIFAIVLLF